MARLPLSQTVDASHSKRSWRSSVSSLIASTLVQGLAITALIVTPLLASQTLPVPANRPQLPDVVIPVAPPPVPPKAGKERHSDRRQVIRKPSVHIGDIFPTEPPDVILDEIDYGDWGEEERVIGGVPFGVGTPSDPAPEPVLPEPTGPIEVGGNIRPPRKIVHVNPVYPRIAIEARVQGGVTLRAILDAQGNVVDLQVIESVPLLDGAAIEAVRQWKYEPTHLNGRAVPVVMSVYVRFQLQ